MASTGAVFYGKGQRSKGQPRELPPVIPVVFLPGVMGSNLRVATGAIPEVRKVFEEAGRAGDFTRESWRPPTVNHSRRVKAAHVWTETRNRDSDAVKLAKRWAGYGPKLRQALLNPQSTEVDPDGVLPEAMGRLFSALDKDGREEARRRGWGSVHWQSYGALLTHLEMSLNWGYAPSLPARAVEGYAFQGHLTLGQLHLPEAVQPTEAELKHAEPFLFPVFAFGYNWTRSNGESAKDLLAALETWIGEYRKLGHDCKHAILVTHSMGGLVARAASKQDTKGLILGVIHGVMPAIGAPVLYRRVVGGWENEDGPVLYPELRGLLVPLAGRTSAETTPVVANAPGVLELLPSHLYPRGWLKVEQVQKAGGGIRTWFDLPEKGDPYEEIYKQKDVWWRLVDPELLDPAHIHSKTELGIEPKEAWAAYTQRIDEVRKFHQKYCGESNYHDPDRAFVFYGSRRKTFDSIRWWVQNTSDFLDWNDVRSGPGMPGDLMTRRTIVKVMRAGAPLPETAKPGSPLYGPAAIFPISTRNQAAANGSPAMIFEPAYLQGLDGEGDETVPLVSGSAPGRRIARTCKLHGFDHQSAFDNPVARAFTVLAICKLAKHSECKVRSQ